MTTLSILILSSWCRLMLGIHENHYSITNIDYLAKVDSVSISIKISTHDLNFALAHNFDPPKELNKKDRNQETDKLIQNYINTTVTISFDTSLKQKLNFIRREVSDDDTWLYLSAPMPKSTTNIEIMQALFFDIYTDQVNLVIFSQNGKTKGFKTTFYERTINIDLKTTVNE